MKSAFLPGGTGGLGKFVTLRLVNENYRCIVPFRKSEEAEELSKMIPKDLRDQLVLFEADMLDETEIARAFKIIEEYGEFNVLVHLLGGIRKFTPITDTTVEDWDFLLNLNLRSFFLTSRLAMQLFKSAGYGRIVSIGAMASVKQSANQGGYGVAKAGVAALTRILADEGRAFGVTVNCIAPGVIKTPANLVWGSEEETEKWVTPEEIAQMISYLLSEHARSVNGSVIQLFGRLNI